MSYSVTFREGSIALRAGAKSAALSALVSLAADGRLASADNGRLCRAMLRATTLESALRAFGWDSCSDAAGDIVHTWMIGDELDHSEEMFRALVPHIEPGSHVEFIGEDGDIWRWSFTGQHMIETYPEFIWPLPPTARWARVWQLLRARVMMLRALWRAGL
jgi:hypothetical protein